MFVDKLGTIFSGTPSSLLSKSSAVVASERPSAEPNTMPETFFYK